MPTRACRQQAPEQAGQPTIVLDPDLAIVDEGIGRTASAKFEQLDHRAPRNWINEGAD
jgi:hypothetical protein